MYIRHHLVFGNDALEVHRIKLVQFSDQARVTIESFGDDRATVPLRTNVHLMPLTALIGSDATKAVYTWLISSDGPHAGGELVYGEDELKVMREVAYKKVGILRDAYINGGCKTPYGVFDTDEVSIRNILGTCQIAAIAAMQQKPFLLDWKRADNTIVALDGNAMITAGAIVMKHVSDCYKVSWACKDKIDATKTYEDMITLDVEACWATVESSPKYVTPADPTPVDPEPVDPTPVDPEPTPTDPEPVDPEPTPEEPVEETPTEPEQSAT